MNPPRGVTPVVPVAVAVAAVGEVAVAAWPVPAGVIVARCTELA